MFGISTQQSGHLTIDLNALCENYQLLQKRVGKKVEITPAVKANAYGLGAKDVVHALHALECRKFFVATLQEALHLRQYFDDISLYVLNGFDDEYATTFLEEGFIPVLSSMKEVTHYRDFAQKANLSLPAYLHFDTGMNRLGIEPEHATPLATDTSLLSHITVKGVMSHLACADTPEHSLNEAQLNLFKAIGDLYPDIPKSFANSSGIFLGEEYHFDEVRPGMALYGLNPTPYNEINPMMRVVQVDLRILSIKTLRAGAFVGYGATYHCDDVKTVAIIGAGYADGIFRSLSNKGAFYWQGMRCPILGRVSMDLTVIDISHIPEEIRPHEGDMVEMIGPHQAASDIGTDAGSFDYEVLTALSSRYERSYKYDPAAF